MSREAKLRQPEHQLQKLRVYINNRKPGGSATETKAGEQIEYRHWHPTASRWIMWLKLGMFFSTSVFN